MLIAIAALRNKQGDNRPFSNPRKGRYLTLMSGNQELATFPSSPGGLWNARHSPDGTPVETAHKGEIACIRPAREVTEVTARLDLHGSLAYAEYLLSIRFTGRAI